MKPFVAIGGVSEVVQHGLGSILSLSKNMHQIYVRISARLLPPDPMHNNLYYRIGSGWYQPLSQGFRRRAALLL